MVRYLEFDIKDLRIRILVFHPTPPFGASSDMTLVLLHLKNYLINNLVRIGGRSGKNRPLEVLSDDLTWFSIALLGLIVEYRLHHLHILPIISQGHNR